MNIHPSPTASPMAPAGWTMDCSFENVNSLCQCICIVFLQGKVMCSISMTESNGDRDAVRLAAAERARAWVADFLKRSNSA